MIFDARPFGLSADPATTALIVIDMQRDFIEPGGFGASLGNDVSLLQAIIPATARLIAGCRAAGIPVFEKNFSLVECYGAEEAFVTGTFGAQTAVGEIDGRVIGTGEMGPMTERIRALYKELVA